MRARDDAAALDAAQEAAAERGAKAMIPFAGGRPFLDYLLSAVADAGFSEVCFVVAPGHDAIRERYTREVEPHRVRLSYAVQAEPRGTADAVLAAAAFAGDDAFLVLNADNYYPAPVLAALRDVPAPAMAGFSREGLLRDGQIPAERIARYALLDVNPDGLLRRIVEKPDDTTARALGDAPVSMNCWLLDAAILEACRRVRPSSRGELELPSAVQLAIDTLGARVHVLPVDAPVLDLSHRADVPTVAARLANVRVEL
ncbi:MAG: NTP transferase domain-containing protein [Gemmatimonadaceae bacterium]|nr:NTP transferase domain-containing protein [Gemmatimonadaceae bacterium]